ncbi:MAG: DNA mismatch endonuclease Vsr [Thermodesulfobacteriota bacterium]|nr:DNA mismatch endonuclease Vsr [Thermodesulfobacteriota bacterium]
MTDVHDKKTRSYNMSQIRAKDTRPEIIVRKYLFSKGFRYRLHDKKLPGTPDLVLQKYKTVIFVNGCFWHGHEGCKYFVLPKTNSEKWIRKINRNRELDKNNIQELNRIGWQVISIFECELKNDKLEKTLENTIRRIRKSDNKNS